MKGLITANEMTPVRNDKRHLITDKNPATGGGIGVSYSTVVLGGGLNPDKGMGSQFVAKKDADFSDPRSRANSQLNGASFTRNRVRQDAGMNNPAAKYDFNILNGNSLHGSPPQYGSPISRMPHKQSLTGAGSQIVLQ
jgi:hypothetical protein